MVQEVTDPGVLEQLNGGQSQGQEVTDPALLQQLNISQRSLPGKIAGGIGAMWNSDQSKADRGYKEAPVRDAKGDATDTIRPLDKPTSVVPAMLDRVKKGVASSFSMLGLPASAIGMALESAGFPKHETAGGVAMLQRFGEKAFGYQGLETPKGTTGQDSKNNEYLTTIAEFAGGMIVPGGAAVQGAAAGKKLATAGVLALQGVAAGMGSVEGAEFAKAHAAQFGVSPEMGEMVGRALGGLAGPTAIGLAGQAVVKSLNLGMGAASKVGITPGASKESLRAAADARVNKEIGVAIDAHPESKENVARAIELKRKVDNFKPLPPQMTDAPGVHNMFHEISNQSPESLARATAVQKGNIDAIAAYKQKTFPAVEGRNPIESAKIQYAATQNVFGMEMNKVSTEMRALSTQFARTVDNRAVGEELRTMYWANQKTAKNTLNGELATVYSDAKAYGIRVDMTDVRESINKIVNADRTTFQDMPATFTKVMNEYPAATAGKMERVATTPTGSTKPIYKTVTSPGTPGNSEASFEEMHSLYKQANKDWIDAVAGGSNPTKARYMKDIKDQLQAKVAEFNDPKYGNFAEKFSVFNKNYSKYSNTFREGAGGDIARRTRSGLSVDSEDIVSKVILQAGDKKKGVQDFMQIYGQDHRAAELLHEGMLDNFSKAAVKGGEINPKLAQAWMEQHKSAMDELPELRNSLAAATQKGFDLVNRKLQLNSERIVNDKSIVAKIAQSGDPDKVVAQAIGDPRYMSALLEGANTMTSRQSLGRAVADAVSQKPNSYEFLMANEKHLKPAMEALGKGHWNNLKDISEMLKIIDRAKAPTSVELTKLQDIGKELAGTSVPSLASKVMAIKSGRISNVFGSLDIGSRFFYKNKAGDILKMRTEAMLNPDIAEAVVTMSNTVGGPTAQQVLNLKQMQYATGMNTLAQGMGDEEHRQRKGKKKE